MKKKWIISDEIRYLMKVNTNDYGQQAVNELIATKLHERTGWKNYFPYQLVKNIKISNNSNVYEEIIRQAVKYGLEEETVRNQLEYTILDLFMMHSKRNLSHWRQYSILEMHYFSIMK